MGVKIALSRRESGVADFRGGFGSGGVGPPPEGKMDKHKLSAVKER